MDVETAARCPSVLLSLNPSKAVDGARSPSQLEIQDGEAAVRRQEGF